MKTQIPQELTCSTCGVIKPAREFRHRLSLAHTQAMRPTATRPIGVMRKICVACRRKKLLAQPAKKIEDAVLKGWLNPLEGQIAIAQKKAARRAQAKARHAKAREIFLRSVDALIQRTRQRHRQNVMGRAHYWELLDSMLSQARDELKVGARRFPNVYGKPDADPMYALTYEERQRLRRAQDDEDGGKPAK